MVKLTWRRYIYCIFSPYICSNIRHLISFIQVRISCLIGNSVFCILFDMPQYYLKILQINIFILQPRRTYLMLQQQQKLLWCCCVGSEKITYIVAKVNQKWFWLSVLQNLSGCIAHRMITSWRSYWQVVISGSLWGYCLGDMNIFNCFYDSWYTVIYIHLYEM